MIFVFLTHFTLYDNLLVSVNVTILFLFVTEYKISQKTKIIASGPIISRQIDEETMKTVTDFIFGGSKITADDDCSHEIKRRLLLGRKVMTNLAY